MLQRADAVRPTRAAPWACRAAAVAAGLVALVRMGLTIGMFNNTIDESANVASAVALYTVGKHVTDVTNAPLPRLVAGLPLYASGVRLPERLRGTTVTGVDEARRQSAAVLFHSSLSWDRILCRARLAMLVFPAAALLYLYLLTRWLAGGEVPAALAVAFFSTDPTLLGHGAWVCSDTAACAGFLAASYHGLRWVALGGKGRAWGAGVAIGLAVACKFSCALIVPALAFAVLIRPIFARARAGDAAERERPRRLWRALSPGQAGIVVAAALVSLWAAYLFNVGRLADQSLFESERTWARLPPRLKSLPVPMPSFALGLLWQLGHNRAGHGAYLNGQVRRHGWWYYFPEAIALKSPLALLAGLALASAVPLWAYRRRRLRPTYLAVAACIPPAAFLATLMRGDLDLGIRYALPALPFLYLFVCVVLARSAALRYILVTLILLAVVETAWVHPDYVAFFNAAGGGPSRGDRFLLDSNLDWGQDCARLGRWLHSDEARARPYTLRLFVEPFETINRGAGLDPAAQFRPPAGLFAISQNVRHGLYGSARATVEEDDEPPQDYRWLDAYPLVKRIGYSITVYDLGPAGASRPPPTRR